MLPDVEAEDRLAFDPGDGLAHDRVVLIRGGADLELAAVHDEPGPAAAEAPGAGRVELLLELIERPEGLLIASASLPDGLPADLALRSFQKKEWFTWPPPLLRTAVRIASGTAVRF